MPTLTTNYNLNKPNVNSADDEDLWGDQLNDNMDTIDTQLKANADLAAAGIVSKSATYTQIAADKNKIILFDATSGDLEYDLLAAATAGNGFEVTVKKIDSSTNTITVDPNGSETIDGAATFVLSGQWSSVVLRSNGTAWFIKAINGILATETTAGIVEKAAVAEVKAETAEKYPDSALLKQHPGIAKSYGNFQGVGSATKNGDGYNFDTVVRNSTGNYTVTFDNAMADANYTVQVSSERGSSGSVTGHVKCSSRSSGSFVIETYQNGAGSNTPQDHERIDFVVFGELA